MGKHRSNCRNRRNSKRENRTRKDEHYTPNLSGEQYLLFEDEQIISARELEESMKGSETNVKDIIQSIMGKKPYVKPKTENQYKLLNLITDNVITFAHGPAGTGKSYIATYSALKMLWNKENPIDKIVIIKPACEVVGEKIGYLPGSADEKISVYAYSTLNIIEKIIGSVPCQGLIKQGFIKPSPLGFIRGCTFDNAVVILEEGQNTSQEQMKTFLSRIGENSKYVITGDINQSDRFFKNPEKSGLADALVRLSDIEGIETEFEFDEDDIVRNPIIKEILNKYEYA
jgi:phosphate starvation-inducible PhoH-like protein